MKARQQRSHKSSRATRRARVQRPLQVGGAAWAEQLAGFGDRWAEWKTELESDPSFIALFTDSASDTEKGAAWLNCIAKQEKLFETAVSIIKKKLGSNMLAADFSNAAAVDARKAEIAPYINDIERFIQFKEDTSAGSAPNVTKIQALLASDTLSKILLFPASLTNTFITSLAGILHSLQKNPEMAAKIEEIRILLAEQYKSIVYTNSYYLTAEKPRDGFFLNQGVSEFTAELEDKNFFRIFVDELARITTAGVPKEQLFILDGETAPNCKKALRDEEKSWGFVTAHFARYFLLEPTLESLFRHFDDCTTEPTDIDKALVPDSIFPAGGTDNIQLDGVPVRKLLYSMGDTTFQFILHLRSRVLELASSPEIAA